MLESRNVFVHDALELQGNVLRFPRRIPEFRTTAIDRWQASVLQVPNGRYLALLTLCLPRKQSTFKVMGPRLNYEGISTDV